MPFTADELYRLLPALYRTRDAEAGGALRALVEVLAEQAAVVEAELDALYDDWFIETCEEWAVPYLGDLLRARALHPVSDATYSQRARVANTLGYRRRKGTAAMLAQLSRDTTGWAAQVVELGRRVSTTQHLAHVRPDHHRTPDLRRTGPLARLGTSFDAVARTADVRPVSAWAGRPNLMNVGIHLWRLRAYPVRAAPAFAHGDGRFSVSPLGQPTPLFHAPGVEAQAGASEASVPGVIRRLALAAAPGTYHGPDRSFTIWGDDGKPARVVSCDLSGWAHRPPAGAVAVDPELGRFAFAAGEGPAQARVSYHYGFSGQLGGGGYARAPNAPARYRVARSGAEGAFPTLTAALEKWREEGRPDATVELADSEVYAEAPRLSVRAGGALVLRAATFCRPVLQLPGPWRVERPRRPDHGAPGALALEGLLVVGAPIELGPGALGRLTLADTTLVPGLALDLDGAPLTPGQPSLVAAGGEGVDHGLSVVVRRSIAGPILGAGALSLEDAIVDAILDPGAPEPPLALRAGALSAEGCTVLGAAQAETVELSNSILAGRVSAARRQQGCVRFCHLGPGSAVPRRHRCTPEPGARAVRPTFTSARYGDPAYGQLRLDCPTEISRGAEDGGEMGAFHHLLQAQRESNLRASLDEYLRVGLEVGLTFVT